MPTDKALAKQTITTYANVLYEGASAAGSVFAAGEDLRQATLAVRTHAELRDALLDSTIPAQVRKDVISDVLAGSDPLVVATIGVMAEQDDIELLPAVSEAYDEAVETRENVTVVDVTTVVELTEALRQAVKEKLAADFGTAIELREHIDPAILGGIVMSAHGRSIDASIISQLDRARMTLSTAPTGGDE